MGSLKERAKTLPRFAIDAARFEEVVLEIKMHGVVVSEKIVHIASLDYMPSSGKTDVTIVFREIK